MRLTGGIFAVAAAASLLLHVLLFASFRYIELEPAAVPQVAVGEMTVVFERMPDVAEPEQAPREWELGEPDAKGYASHPLDGPREAVARQGNVDQAELSLDPRGQTPVVERPTELVEASSQGGTPIPPVLLEAVEANLRDWAARIRMTAVAVRMPVIEPESLPVAPEPLQATSEEMSPVVATQTTPQSVPPPPPPVVPLATTQGASPVVRSAAADPAPQSDSESDSFSTLGSAEFRDGRFSVRAGRKVKTRRPKLGLAGSMDIMQRRPVRVVLNVEVDKSGKVTSVDVAKSSGTNEIDQPCKVAMYEWWFEPRTDASGRAVPDKFQFTIGFP